MNSVPARTVTVPDGAVTTGVWNRVQVPLGEEEFISAVEVYVAMTLLLAPLARNSR